MDFGDLITQTLSLFRNEKYFIVLSAAIRLCSLMNSRIPILPKRTHRFARRPACSGRYKQNITAVCDDDQCLPPDTQVETPSGRVAIKDIQPGDVVITSVERLFFHIHRRMRKNAKARFITFVTDNGATVEATDNPQVLLSYSRKNWVSILLRIPYASKKFGMAPGNNR